MSLRDEIAELIDCETENSGDLNPLVDRILFKLRHFPGEELPERYRMGEYSRRNVESFIDDVEEGLL